MQLDRIVGDVACSRCTHRTKPDKSTAPREAFEGPLTIVITILLSSLDPVSDTRRPQPIPTEGVVRKLEDGKGPCCSDGSDGNRRPRVSDSTWQFRQLPFIAYALMAKMVV